MQHYDPTGRAAAKRPSAAAPSRRSISMHDGIAVWCDCCSCEAEPYWVEAMARIGVHPGSDYEDEPEAPPGA